MAILAFWILFGWFTDYSFPYGQVIELIGCCFKGSIAIKINSLQKQLQNKEIISQPDNSRQVRRLNEWDSEAWLYIEVLTRLGVKTSDSHERIAKTIEALKQKRNEILSELEPRRPKKYKILASFQDFIQSLVLEEAEKDYYEIDKIVNSLVWTLRNSQPSETIVEELLERLVLDTNQNKAKISLFRLGLLYKLEELLNGIALKKTSTSNVTETNHASRDLIDDLRFQRDILTEEFSKLFNQNQVKQQELNKNHEDLAILRKIISERTSTIALLREEAEKYTEINHNNQAQINELANRLKQAVEELSQLKVERKNLIKNNLSKQSEINDLAEQLRKFS